MSSGTAGPSRAAAAGLVPHVPALVLDTQDTGEGQAVPDVPVPAVPAAPSVAASFMTP